MIVWSSEAHGDRLRREVAAANQPLVVLFDAQHPGEPDQAAVVGEDATTSVRRPISLLKRSSGLVDLSLRQCAAGNA
jgi:hypothetical protein